MYQSKELRERRAGLAEQAGALLKAAREESRSLNAEEQQKFDRIHADIDSIAAEIDRAERQERIDAELSLRDGNRLGRENTPSGPPGEVTAADRSEALRAWLLASSHVQLSDEQRNVVQRCGLNLSSREMHLSFAKRAPRSASEARALGISTVAGGLATVPDELLQQLEESLLWWGGGRESATVIRTASGADLPFPTVDDTSNKGALLGENTSVSEQDVTFGQIVLNAYKYSSKMVKVSVELLQDSGINLEQYLGRALGTRIGRITNEHFTTGTGAGQPKGIVTASGLGKTGAGGQTTSVTYADLVDLQHSVDPAYRPTAKWMFADSTLKALKKLLDGDDRPLWSSGIAVKEPDTILGQPYVVNQDMPVMAASAKSILYGAFDKYLIRDVQGITILRLDERYADLHQVAFLAFSRHDGDLLDAGTDPVKHYINAAS